LSVLILAGSSRADSNSKALAERVVEGIPHTLVELRTLTIQPIDDKRHTPEGFQPVPDDYDKVVEEMLKHEILLFATPLYWYGMSGHMKNFIDRWSQSLRDPRFSFKETMKGKKAYVIITGGDNPRLKGLPLVQQFQYIFEFMNITFAGYLLGEANKPGDIWNDTVSLEQAKYLNQALKSQLGQNNGIN
jgi:multimeric flavodoxin WrbA